MKKHRKSLWQAGGFLLALGLIAALFACTHPSAEPTEALQPTATLPANTLLPADFYFDGDYLACSACPTTLGIDVSYYQGDIDWPTVRAAGVEFVMVRLGRRETVSGKLGADEMAQQNLTGARAAGLKVGAYFYSQATTVREAREEAALALELLGDFSLDLPMVFDWEQEERTANVDARTLTDCTLAFCQATEAGGERAMIYFNRYQAAELLYLEELTDYPWWLAMYDLEGQFPYRMDMWQYTCTGSVPGISGSVDINLLFDDALLS